VEWKGTTVVTDKDAGHSIKFGGRIMYDWSFISPDEDLDAAFPDEFTDGSEFRRARFYSSGTVYHVVYYKAQYDYAADGTSEFKDVYVGVEDIPLVGAVQAGHMYEPFGLEEQTSSKVITFMERALTSNMTPSRKGGIMFKRELENKRATFAGGVFRNSDDYGRAEDHDYNVTARVTAVPMVENEGEKLVHVGAAMSVRTPADDTAEIEARASTHISPKLSSTGSMEYTERLLQFGGEGAVIFGPASLQSEFIVATATNDTLNDPSFHSFYVQASYVLTGEHRGYKEGLMDGVKPAKNFDGQGGRGAWEIGARFARIDLDADAVTGGTLGDITVGLNWYLNPAARIMFNYVYADLKDVGTSNAFMTRFQIGF
jgi:phosphate-selective porin OprO/OprP